MSPEYAMEGLFSIKSDVFSYGVLLLEIISGRKNTSTFDDGTSVNLIGHVCRFILPLSVTHKHIHLPKGSLELNLMDVLPSLIGLESLGRRKTFGNS